MFSYLSLSLSLSFFFFTKPNQNPRTMEKPKGILNRSRHPSPLHFFLTFFSGLLSSSAVDNNNDKGGRGRL